MRIKVWMKFFLTTTYMFLIKYSIVVKNNYVHIYMCVYVCARAHINVHVHVHVYVCVCVCKCKHYGCNTCHIDY